MEIPAFKPAATRALHVLEHRALSPVAAWGTSPLRLAALSLLLLVILAGHDASAHTPLGSYAGSTYQTGNLIEWGLPNSTVVVNQNPNTWCLPIPCGGTTSTQIQNQLRGWSSLSAGGYGGGAYTEAAFVTGAVNQNISAMNYTWAVDVPVSHTSGSIRFAGTSGGSATFFFVFKNVGGSEIGSASFSPSCSNTASTTFALTTGSLLNTVRKVEVWANYTGCTNGGTFQWERWTVWGDSVTQAQATSYVRTPLELSDFMNRDRLRSGFDICNQDGNPCSITGRDLYAQGYSMAVPPGTSYLYLMSTCGGQSVTTCSIVHPITGFNQTHATITSRFIGATSLLDANSESITVWEIVNSGATSASIQIGGVMTNVACCPGGIYWNWDDKVNKTFGQPSSEIIAFTCDCYRAGITDTIGFLYPPSVGPLVTSPLVGISTEGTSKNLDIQNASFIGLFPGSTTTFSFSLQREQYFGNAILLNLAFLTNNADCNTTNSTITVNGLASTAFRVDQMTFARNATQGMVCWWLIDDFNRVNSIPADSLGRHQDLDNSRASKTYNIVITGFFNPAQAGIMALQTINGTFVQCTGKGQNVNNNLPVCYGNLDTTGYALPGGTDTLKRWTFTTYSDANGTSAVGNYSLPGVDFLNNTRVFESVSGISAYSGVAPNTFAYINNTGTLSRFVFTKEGYRTEYANVTGVPSAAEIQFRVYLTGNYSNFPNLACNFAGQAPNTGNPAYTCVLSQASSIANARICQEVNIITNACGLNVGGGPIVETWVLDCTRDRAQPGYQNVTSTWLETTTNTTVQVPAGGDTFAAACDTHADLLARGTTVSLDTTGTGRWLVAAPGYKTLDFTLTGVTADVIHIQPYHVTGSGTTTGADLEITYDNRSSFDFGLQRVVSVSYVSVLDATEVGVAGEPVGSRPSIGAAFVNLGASLGFVGDSLVIWGFILFGMITALLYGLVLKTTGEGPSGGFAAGLAFVAFGVTVSTGVWPLWFVVLVVLGMAVVVVQAVKGD